MSIVVTDDVQRPARVEAGLARNAAVRHGARILRAQTLNISRTGCSECCERRGAHNPSLRARLPSSMPQVQKCRCFAVQQSKNGELGFSMQALLGFWLFASVLHAASSARRAFSADSSHTRSRGAATRVKIINRCGVASLRQSNRCGSPTICKQAARRRPSAARRGEQQSAKNDHAAATRPRPRRRQPARMDDGQRKRQT